MMARAYGAVREDAKGKPFAPWAIAARRLGVSLEEYTRQRVAGNLWCWRCRRWRRKERFGHDRARRFGRRNTSCIECQQEIDKERAR